MSEKSILEMVGGEKHINPHYNIKAEKKGVTMFEKEAEDSFNCKKVLYKWETDKHSYIDGYIDSAEPREKRIAELEKENAELKDYRLNTMAKEQTEMSKYALNLEHKLSWYDDQLTKAKDHIKKLIDCLQQDTNDPQTNHYVVQYMTEAEQFLKEK